MIVYNGNLVASGWFTKAGGNNASFIAQWNGSAWSPMGKGFNSWVKTLAIYNGNLIAGGSFDSADGKPANAIA